MSDADYFQGYSAGYKAMKDSPWELEGLTKLDKRQREGILAGIEAAIVDGHNENFQEEIEEPSSGPFNVIKYLKENYNISFDMETVDPKYKLMFNIGHNLSNSDDTRKLVQQMIEKAPNEQQKEALRKGREAYMEKLLKRQGEKMTTKTVEMEEAWHSVQDRDVSKKERDETALLAKYYEGLDGYGDEQLTKAIESERQLKQSEKVMSENDDIPGRPEGPPPIIDPNKPMTPEEKNRFQQGTDWINSIPKQNEKPLSAIERLDAAKAKFTPEQKADLERMEAERKEREQEKDGDWERD